MVIHTGRGGVEEELIMWEKFIGDLKMRLEVELDLDKIFKGTVEWMKFCNYNDFQDIFGTQFDITFALFKESIQKCGSGVSVERIYSIF